MHEDHRNRMRERIISSGLDSLQPHEILEYILYAFIPRKDTNSIAHALIEAFGSLANVLNAAYDDLFAVKGMTKNAALFLTLMPSIGRAYQKSLLDAKVRLTGYSAMSNYIKRLFYGLAEEAVYLISLDVHDNLINTQLIAKGDNKSVAVSAKVVVNAALRAKASSVVIAHNHPRGNATPSDADIDLTGMIAVLLKLLNIALYDHIIFAGEECFSFRNAGMTAFWDENCNRFLDGAKIKHRATIFTQEKKND